MFYHRSSGNSEYHRRLCVEKINFNEDGSSAVFRYISLDRTPQEVITDCSGDGKLTVLADGKAIAEAEPGTYEIKVTCKGDVVLHSVTIQ